MAEEVFCQGCKIKINTIPFVGDKFKKFEDGHYCIHCAKIKIDSHRRRLNG